MCEVSEGLKRKMACAIAFGVITAVLSRGLFQFCSTRKGVQTGAQYLVKHLAERARTLFASSEDRRT